VKVKRKKLTKNQGDLYRLEGQGKKLEKILPGDGVAISWAAGVLIKREGDPRPGEIMPDGDYTLSIVGVQVVEPIFILSKPGAHESVVSWVAA
jgi:hypothetical protein